MGNLLLLREGMKISVFQWGSNQGPAHVYLMFYTFLCPHLLSYLSLPYFSPFPLPTILSLPCLYSTSLLSSLPSSLSSPCHCSHPCLHVPVFISPCPSCLYLLSLLPSLSFFPFLFARFLSFIFSYPHPYPFFLPLIFPLLACSFLWLDLI